MGNNEVLNAFTVDVEDYYQVSAFEKDLSRDKWDAMPSRVSQNTEAVLQLLDDQGVKGTFFVLGMVAEKHKRLVEQIAVEGHEVACHGYSHKLIYKQDIGEFREETLKAKSILEDIVQKPVLGYRAASYSITNKSLWALDVLVDAGFTYDSSIFPVYHDRYGIPDCAELPHVITSPSGGTLVEFPLSIYKIMKYKLPVSGGGYFRLYPYGFTRFALSSLNKQQKPFIFYVHPWEIDPDQPKITTNMLSRFRHYNNLSKCADRLKSLLKDFNFERIDNILRTNGFEI